MKLRIVDSGMRIEKKPKKSEIRNPQSEITEPILFPRNPAIGGTSGPQACFFAEKGTAKVRGAIDCFPLTIFELEGYFLLLLPKSSSAPEGEKPSKSGIESPGISFWPSA